MKDDLKATLADALRKEGLLGENEPLEIKELPPGPMVEFVRWTCPTCHTWDRIEITADAKYSKDPRFVERWVDPALEYLRHYIQEHKCERMQ